MSSDNSKKGNAPLRLDSLPDFLRSAEPQVRFNSAFPPLTTKVRVRGVMERAGFDVYKPERDASIQSKTSTINELSQIPTAEFYPHPPNKFAHSNRSVSSNNSSPSKKSIQFRSFSHNTKSALHSSSSLPIRKPPILSKLNHSSTDSFEDSLNYSKTRNSNKTNINNIHTTSDETKKPTSILLNKSDSLPEPLKKKKSIFDLAKQKLNIHLPSASTQPKPVISAPISSESLPIAPDLIAPTLKISSSSSSPSPSPAESSFNIQKKSVENPEAEHNEPNYEFDPNFNTISYEEDYNNYNHYNNYSNNIPQITGEFIPSNSKEEENNEDVFKSSVQLPNRNSTQLHGPKEYVSSDDESYHSIEELDVVSGDSVIIKDISPHKNNDLDLISQKSSILTTGTHQLNIQLVESNVSNPNILNPNDLDDDEAIRQSVGSFDAKFMLQNASDQDRYEDDHDFEEHENFDYEPELTFDNSINNTSQDSFGGLTGFKNVIKPIDYEDPSSSIKPLVPDVTSPYEQNYKRISTLSTNDMRIYNLQSLNDDVEDNESIGFGNHQENANANQMSMIQEGEIEDSRLDYTNRTSEEIVSRRGSKIINTLNAPDIVIEFDDDVDDNDDVDDDYAFDDHNGSQSHSVRQQDRSNPFDSDVEDHEDVIDSNLHSVQQYEDYNTQPQVISQEKEKLYEYKNTDNEGNENLSGAELVPQEYRRRSQDFNNNYETEYSNDNQFSNENQYSDEYENDYYEHNKAFHNQNYDDPQSHDQHSHNYYDNVSENYNHIDNDELIRRGFTKRNASAVSTPNQIHEQTLPTLTQPIVSNNDAISRIINNIENFDISNNADTPKTIAVNDDAISDSNELKDNETSKVSSYESNHGDHDHCSPHCAPNIPHTLLGVTSPEDVNFENNQPYNSNELEKNIGNDETNIAIDDKNSTPYYKSGEGPCRKCGKEILSTEKKIWSKDHQLSGQWHRTCFGCNTCDSKFNKGSSCYVFNDQPYCESHFHELNGSLCKICNKGVEGECLQNDVNEAFHIDCLKCVICGLNVQGDYFIFRDEVMCETDAKELIYQIEEAEKDYQDDKDVDKIIKRRTRILYL